MEKTKNNFLGFLFGLWLALVYVVVLVVRVVTHAQSESMLLYMALGGALLWPLVYFAFGHQRFLPAGLRIDVTIALVVFAMFCLFSSFGSPIPIVSMAFSLLTIACVFIVFQFSCSIDSCQLESGLKTYALVMGLALGVFALHIYVPGQRLGNESDTLNPNAIGMVTLSAAICSMALGSQILRLLFFVNAIVIIYLTGSRASMIGALIGVSVIVVSRIRSEGGRLAIFPLLIAGLVIGVVVVEWEFVADFAGSFLQVNEANRGVESGFSGRTQVWSEVWTLFLDNMIFGIGFRAHEVILGISSHNGYLATAAEVGIVGYLAVMYIIIRGVALLNADVGKQGAGKSLSVLFGLCVSYLFLAMFERFLINVGNPTSLLFLFAVLYPTILRDR